MSVETRIHAHTSFDPILKARFTGLMVTCIVIAGLMMARAAYIQILSHPKLEAMAKRQYTSKAYIRPQRGMITDRNGEALAVNIEVKSLAANPLKLNNKRGIARLLAKATDVPYSKIYKRISEKKEFIWIKRHLSEVEMKRLKKLKLMDSDEDLIDGLWFVSESNRVYPHGQVAGHILGDVNVDAEGVEGVELWQNDQLKGKTVAVSATKDALGRPTFIDTSAAKTVQEGQVVALTIDSTLQFEVEQELRASVEKTGAQGGSVIVMNASTGEILAMANEPSFNPNQKGVPIEKRRNRAITDGYEPGSTVKALLAVSALTNGWKLTDEVWGEKGSFILQKHRISEAEAHEKFEWVSLKKMIQVSSNVAAAKVALKLGADHYMRSLQLFGLGSKTGIGFPGEISGKIPPRKQWQPLTLANIGFGQGVLVTPLQMTRAYAAIANGGFLVQPRLIQMQPQASVAESAVRIFSQRVSEEAIEALQAVTETGGTGTKATLPGLRVAGKTGTAQMVDPETGHYSRSKYIASFIGFPVEVNPRMVIFTSLIEPKGIYYASETAAPLFREVLASVANRCNLPMKVAPVSTLATQSLHHDEIKLTQAEAVAPGIETSHFNPSLKETEHMGTLESGLQSAVPHAPSIPRWSMPSLLGLSPREALRAFKGHRFRIEITGSGVISSQFPEEGKTLVEGDQVRLILNEP
jgi:cell division protein FtsI (penicillin-binding protein 3)